MKITTTNTKKNTSLDMVIDMEMINMRTNKTFCEVSTTYFVSKENCINNVFKDFKDIFFYMDSLADTEEDLLLLDKTKQSIINAIEKETEFKSQIIFGVYKLTIKISKIKKER